MTCRQTRRLLSVQREWTVRDRAAVEDHLAGCPGCQAIAREYELMDRRLGRLPEPILAGALPASVQAQIVARGQIGRTESLSRRRPAVWGIALVAAVVALVAVAGLVWFGEGPGSVLKPRIPPVSGPSMPAAASPTPEQVVVPAIPPVVKYPLNVWLGEEIRLQGYGLEAETIRPGEAVRLTLFWQAASESERAYRVFVHLLDEDSRLWGQVDTGPGEGTTAWGLGQVSAAEYELPLGPSIPPGEYVLVVGMYQADTGQRLPITDGEGVLLGDQLLLEPGIHVEAAEHAPAPLSPTAAPPPTLTPSLSGEREHLEFVWPALGCVSQAYSSEHAAVDIANQIGTPIYAVADGQVREAAQDDDRHGIYLVLEHAEGFETFYSHLSTAHVESGEPVERGQEIGLMGDTGMSTGPHLHFEVRQDGQVQNPFLLIEGESWMEQLVPVPGPDSPAGHADSEAEGFVWPTSGHVTQGYWSGHPALDIANTVDTPVYAVGDGQVIEGGEDSRHGIYLRLEHAEGFVTFYSHLDAVKVEEGEPVERGQTIGALGNTGLTTGPHLHFELHKEGKPVNPFDVLPEVGQ